MNQEFIKLMEELSSLYDEDDEGVGPLYGEGQYAVCIEPDGDSDWTYFDNEDDATEYFNQLMNDVEADPSNFGDNYTIQLWSSDEIVAQFSTNEEFNEVRKS